MVCAMGLLDDAIREHLELKRRSGADPGEVARQQREALAPVGGGEAAPLDGEPGFDERAGRENSGSPAPGPALDEHPTAAHERLAEPPEEVAPHGVQETAEIDMQEVLEGDGAAVEDPAGDPRGFAVDAQAGADEELEWEVAPRGRDPDELDEVPREIPGQERLSFE